jgi:hypothetical protein
MARVTHDLEFAILGQHERHAAYIADIIANWNIVEHSMFMVLTEMLGTKPHHARHILSAVASSQARLAIVSAIGAVELKKDPELLKEFNDAMKALSGALRLRNQYAHGIYVLNRNKQLCILHREWDLEIPLESRHIRVLHETVLLREMNSISGASKKLKAVRLKLAATLTSRTHATLTKNSRY